MEIQVNKLRQVLDLLKPVVPRKTSLPILTHVLFNDGQAIASDLESMVIAELPEAKEPMLLPFNTILDLVKYVPGYEMLKVETKRGKVTLSWSAGAATYDTEKPEEFPPVPGLKVQAEGRLDGDSLISTMLSVLPYAATEDTRPVLSGVTVILGNPIVVAAADGFQLGYQALPLSFPAERTIVVPSAAVSLLGHLLSRTPRTPPLTDALVPAITAKRQIDIALAENRLRVGFGAAQVIITLIQGSPPDFLLLIPKEEPVLKAQLFGPEFEAAVRRVSAVAREGSGAVRLVFNDGTATVSAIADDREVEATISTMGTQGAPNKVAINASYLLGYLKGKEGIVTLSFTAPTAPILFQYQRQPKVVIMPMNVDWPGDAKPAPPATAEAPQDIKEAVETEEPEETGEDTPETPVDETSAEPVDMPPAETTAEAPATEPTPPKAKRGSRRKSTEPAG